MMNRLFNLIPPPVNPKETGTSKSWEKIETRLGLQLPADYKDFIDHYGTGSFNNFIMVYNPFALDEYYNLFYALDTLHQADRLTQMMGDPVWTAVHPFGLYPANEGLLPWGGTTNMDNTFFWQIKGAPETWETIFYNLRYGEYEVWKYPLTEFLYRLVTRQIESVLLPEDYPLTERPISFKPTLR
ncbi:SMI1/KNR4 family protein [Chloroflexota bacterium]